jgi:hypothetical protein
MSTAQLIEAMCHTARPVRERRDLVSQKAAGSNKIHAKLSVPKPAPPTTHNSITPYHNAVKIFTPPRPRSRIDKAPTLKLEWERPSIVVHRMHCRSMHDRSMRLR